MLILTKHMLCIVFVSCWVSLHHTAVSPSPVFTSILFFALLQSHVFSTIQEVSLAAATTLASFANAYALRLKKRAVDFLQ